MNRLGFSTLGCPEADFAAVLALASNHGVGVIELRCLAGDVLTPSSLDRLLPATAEARQQLDAAGLRIGMLDTSVRLLDADPESVEHLVEWARRADALQCPWLRIFDGGQYGVAPTADELDRAARWFAAWEDQRRAHGLRAKLAVETHDALVRLAAIDATLTALPGLRVLWDAHHTWRAGVPLQPCFQRLQSHLVHVHAKDSRTARESSRGHAYVPPGEGEFPWNELSTLMRDAWPTVALCFEWERHWHPELAPLADVLPAFVHHARETG